MHKYSLVLGGVSLVMGRIHHVVPALSAIVVEIDPFLKAGFAPNQHFDYINGIIRFGLESDLNAEVLPVIKKYREQPFAIQIPMGTVAGVPLNQAKQAIRRATLIALFDIARRYNLSDVPLQRYESEWMTNDTE